MPSDVLNLDELIGEDIEVKWRGKSYWFPGDIDTETTFVLGEFVRQLAVAETTTDIARIELAQAEGLAGTQKAAKTVDELERKQKELTLRVEGRMLDCFKARHPELEKLPFGARGMQAILARILIQLGYGGAARTTGPSESGDAESRGPEEIDAVELVAALVDEFGFTVDGYFWRRMPWIEFRAWLKLRGKRVRERRIAQINAERRAVDSTVRVVFLGNAASAVRSVNQLERGFGTLGRAAHLAAPRSAQPSSAGSRSR
jgi:hypothetical protein